MTSKKKSRSVGKRKATSRATNPVQARELSRLNGAAENAACCRGRALIDATLEDGELLLSFAGVRSSFTD